MGRLSTLTLFLFCFSRCLSLYWSNGENDTKHDVFSASRVTISKANEKLKTDNDFRKCLENFSCDGTCLSYPNVGSFDKNPETKETSDIVCNANCFELSAMCFHSCWNVSFEAIQTCEQCVKRLGSASMCLTFCQEICVDPDCALQLSSKKCRVCKPDEYGPSCKKCHKKCNGFCYEDTGFCEICPLGLYGQSCENPCPSNCLHSHCSTENGKCLQCTQHFTGDKCEKECPAGFFGKACTDRCPTNCVDRLCDMSTRRCLYGCTAGYFGLDCATPCPNSKYGTGCFADCSLTCKENTSCHHVNGECTYGCQQGFSGDFCEHLCPPGFWGLHCRENCSKQCFKQLCNPFNGYCRSCRAGYEGVRCDQKVRVRMLRPLSVEYHIPKVKVALLFTSLLVVGSFMWVLVGMAVYYKRKFLLEDLFKGKIHTRQRHKYWSLLSMRGGARFFPFMFSKYMKGTAHQRNDKKSKQKKRRSSKGSLEKLIEIPTSEEGTLIALTQAVSTSTTDLQIQAASPKKTRVLAKESQTSLPLITCLEATKYVAQKEVFSALEEEEQIQDGTKWFKFQEKSPVEKTMESKSNHSMNKTEENTVEAPTLLGKDLSEENFSKTNEQLPCKTSMLQGKDLSEKHFSKINEHSPCKTSMFQGKDLSEENFSKINEHSLCKTPMLQGKNLSEESFSKLNEQSPSKTPVFQGKDLSDENFSKINEQPPCKTDELELPSFQEQQIANISPLSTKYFVPGIKGTRNRTSQTPGTLSRSYYHRQSTSWTSTKDTDEDDNLTVKVGMRDKQAISDEDTMSDSDTVTYTTTITSESSSESSERTIQQRDEAVHVRPEGKSVAVQAGTEQRPVSGFKKIMENLLKRLRLSSRQNHSTEEQNTLFVKNDDSRPFSDYLLINRLAEWQKSKGIHHDIDDGTLEVTMGDSSDERLLTTDTSTTNLDETPQAWRYGQPREHDFLGNSGPKNLTVSTVSKTPSTFRLTSLDIPTLPETYSASIAQLGNNINDCPISLEPNVSFEFEQALQDPSHSLSERYSPNEAPEFLETQLNTWTKSEIPCSDIYFDPLYPQTREMVKDFSEFNLPLESAESWCSKEYIAKFSDPHAKIGCATPSTKGRYAGAMSRPGMEIILSSEPLKRYLGPSPSLKQGLIHENELKEDARFTKMGNKKLRKQYRRLKPYTLSSVTSYVKDGNNTQTSFVDYI